MKKLNYFFSSALLAVLLFASATVMGQNPFYVNLIQPNTVGTEIVIGDDYLISWEDNLSQPVDVWIDRATGTFELLSNVANPNGVVGTTWIWDTDSENVTTGCKIRIKSHVSPDTYQTDSEIVFNLVNYASTDAIVVEQPSVTGISWAQGSIHTIYWSNTVGDAVTLSYTKDGTNYIDINGGATITGNSYDWTVPNDPTTTCKVKVTGASGLSAESAQNFAITLESGIVQDIYQPNALSDWATDKSYLISWKDDFTELVDIYIKDVTTPTNKERIGHNVTGSTFLWNLATNPGGTALIPGNKYKIIIQSNVTGSVEYLSDEFDIVETVGDISVIYQPINTTSWTKNTRHLISWLDDISGTVDVTWNRTAPTAASGNVDLNVTGTTCYWDIPDVAGTYTITITSDDYPGIVKPSDPFTVTASSGTTIEVLQPSVAGLNWAYNTSNLISWNDDFPENVQIQLVSFSDVGGTLDRTLEGDIIASVASSTHVWDIDATFGALDADRFYKVKIRSINDLSIADSSTNTFTINATSGTFVEVLQPNGGEDWVFGSTYLISWNDDLPENVFIYLDEYNGATLVETIDIETTSPGISGSTYEWTIDEGAITYTNQFKVRIVSVLDPTNPDYGDDSDGYFTIWPQGKSPSSNPNFDINLVSVYPNPANGSVNIFAPVAINQVVVRNMLGQVVSTNNVGTEKTSIDISSFDAGLYIVNVIIEGNVVTKKLFVQ